MSRIQRFVQRVTPRWAVRLEAATRQWQITCAAGHSHDLWDFGGIRAGASGNPSYRGRCPTCGMVGPMRVEKKPGEE